MIILTDIHGNFNTMMTLLNKISEEEKAKGIVICGDLIDRGPRSMQVVQYCIDHNILVVTGNHEQMMVNWYVDGCNYNDMLWLRNGGLESLDSYKEVDENEIVKGNVDWELFKNHIEYMRQLPLYLEFPEIKNDEGRYLVVSHSIALNTWKFRNSEDHMGDQFKQQVTWGRPLKINNVPEIYNVFGHTPQENGPRIRSNYANIDTGCFYKRPGYGKLTALQFPEMKIYTQENID